MSRSEVVVKASEVLAKLEAGGSEKTRAIYARHGAEKSFGTSAAFMGQLKKSIKQDQALAVDLWESGFYEARYLATMVADPAAMTPELLERWVASDRFHGVVEAVAKLTAQGPSGKKLLAKWTRTKQDPLRAAGYTLLSVLGDELDDAECEKFLATIEKEIHGSPNRARHAMNMALCSIGIQRSALRAAAVAAAKRIGKVEVDHGDTACETPDAATYIAKGAARAKKKAGR